MHKVFLIITIFFTLSTPLRAQEIPTVTGSEVLTSHIAPGESILVLVKLVNFGNKERVDVLINYRVFGPNGESILKETETVAVETTAQFVRSLLIPENIKEGGYTVESNVIYPDQISPALSSFNFTVEKKYFGIFESTLILYSKIIGAIIFMTILITFLIARRQKSVALLHDYSDIPGNERMYYEIISDIITQMRLSIGKEAITLARNIEGLNIDSKTGKVISIQRDPSEISSEIMSLFEKKYGSRFNISFDKNRLETRAIIKQ